MKCRKCKSNASVVYDMKYYCKRCFHNYEGFAVDFKRFINWLKSKSRGGAVRADNDLVIMTISTHALRHIYEDAKEANAYVRSKSAKAVKNYIGGLLKKAEKAKSIDKVKE